MQVLFCPWLDIIAIDCDCRKAILIAFAAYCNLTAVAWCCDFFGIVILSPCQWLCLIFSAGWYDFFEPDEVCLQIRYLHLYWSPSRYLHLHLSPFTCFWLLPSTPAYFYLNLSRSIYTSLCAQYFGNIYICILMYNISIDLSTDSSFYVSKHIQVLSKTNQLYVSKWRFPIQMDFEWG